MQEVKKVASITNLEVKEISVVTWGANNKGFFAIKEDGNFNDNENVFWLAKEKKGDVMPDDKKVVEDKTVLDKSVVDDKTVVDEKTPKVDLDKEQMSKEDLFKEIAILKAKDAVTQERLRKAEEDRLAERAIRIEKEFIQKAKDEYNLIGDSNKLGKVLMEASEKMSKESNEYLAEILKSSHEKIKTGNLFKEAGTDNTQSAMTGLDKIDALAKERASKDKITYEDALAKIFDENKELYKEYIETEI